MRLDDLGHDVGASVVADGDQMCTAVEAFAPDLIVAPYLKRVIPEDVWRAQPCLIVHPGIRGDRGPSSLDWAILRRAPRWGVTVLQADAVLDAGDIWAHRQFPMRDASKSALYRHEVADAAIGALLEALARLDLVHDIVETDSQVVISALAGNAGAGGVPLALAADDVCARPGWC